MIIVISNNYNKIMYITLAYRTALCVDNFATQLLEKYFVAYPGNFASIY